MMSKWAVFWSFSRLFYLSNWAIFHPPPALWILPVMPLSIHIFHDSGRNEYHRHFKAPPVISQVYYNVVKYTAYCNYKIHFNLSKTCFCWWLIKGRSSKHYFSAYLPCLGSNIKSWEMLWVWMNWPPAITKFLSTIWTANMHRKCNNPLYMSKGQRNP